MRLVDIVKGARGCPTLEAERVVRAFINYHVLTDQRVSLEGFQGQLRDFSIEAVIGELREHSADRLRLMGDLAEFNYKIVHVSQSLAVFNDYPALDGIVDAINSAIAAAVQKIHQIEKPAEVGASIVSLPKLGFVEGAFQLQEDLVDAEVIAASHDRDGAISVVFAGALPPSARKSTLEDVVGLAGTFMEHEPFDEAVPVVMAVAAGAGAVAAPFLEDLSEAQLLHRALLACSDFYYVLQQSRLEITDHEIAHFIDQCQIFVAEVFSLKASTQDYERRQKILVFIELLKERKPLERALELFCLGIEYMNKSGSFDDLLTLIVGQVNGLRSKDAELSELKGLKVDRSVSLSLSGIGPYLLDRLEVLAGHHSVGVSVAIAS